MIGTSSLPKNLSPQAVPKLNRKRAVLVVSKIDEILAWEKVADQERSARYLELGRYLCEARAGQYWRVDNLRSFEEFLERKFPHSRRMAYYFMAIYEGLPRQIHRDLQKVGWTKAVALAKIARREGEEFECDAWLQKAQKLPKEEFRCAVEKHLTGRQTEPRDIVYFQVSKNQRTVIEQAIAVAASIVGADKSRTYCLEMICADFVLGASREPGDENMLFGALTHLVEILPLPQRLQLLEVVKKSLESIEPEAPEP